MNRGLMLKAVREIWPATLLCGGLLFGVEAVLSYVLPTFQSQFSESFMQIEFFQKLISAMLGVSAGEQIGSAAFMAFPWIHPVALSLAWAHAIICCTRTPAGEIDAGTADLLFTLPVTRWEILRSETAVWLAAGALMMALALSGYLVGTHFAAPAERPAVARAIIVVLNLFCAYVAVGGLTWLASTLSDRRAPAITVVFMLLLASLLLNYLSQFWEPAQNVAFLGVLNYFRPMYILREGSVPWRDIFVLLSVALLTWTMAGVVFSRRDVSTT